MASAHKATVARRDAFHVAPNIAIVEWMRPAAGAREEDDARQRIVLAFKELAPCSVRFEFLEYWNGSKMRPEYWHLPVTDSLVMPKIPIAEADADESLPAKIGQVRRDWERHREKYVAIAATVCRGDHKEAERLHTALVSGAIDTSLVVARYLQLHAEGEKEIVGRIAADNHVNASTVHRHLKAAKKCGRWPALAKCYPRRAGMRHA